MSFRSEVQAANIMGPRRGSVWAQAVDDTARPYNIGILPFGGKPVCNANQVDHIFLTLHAEGGDVYFFLDTATGSALSDTAANAAGTPLTATTMSASTAMCMRIPAGGSQEIRIERSADSWIQLKTSTGTATLRVYASSNAEV